MCKTYHGMLSSRITGRKREWPRRRGEEQAWENGEGGEQKRLIICKHAAGQYARLAKPCT